MNKKLILLFGLTFVFAFTSCGPAAEEKARMLSNSKRIADSVAFIIKSSMDAAAEPGPQQIVVPASPTAASTSTVK